MSDVIQQILAPAVELQLPVGMGADKELVYETFKLAFDFNAICEVKTKTGKSLLNGEVWASIEDDPELLSAILWGGLSLYHPQLTLPQVRGMMLSGVWTDLLPKIVEAWNVAKPKSAKAQEDPNQTPVAEPVQASK